MPKQWTAQAILQMAGQYQPACVLAAAAELELFDAMGAVAFTAEEAARKVGADLRGMTVLLDALAALELLEKHAGRYQAVPSALALLTAGAPGGVLAMVQHQANCARRWMQLAKVVKTGRPAERTASIRGEAADNASFIEAMNEISAPVADVLVREIGPPPFRHMLDVGGGSGTWTAAFLRAAPAATATIFDLPQVIPAAQRRMEAAGLSGRVNFVAGDYNTDRLPAGADLVLLSAIIHQNSRPQNRELFGRCHDALTPGGIVLIRDIVMEADRVHPPAGALFAVNMLTGTSGGGTWTLEEIRQDLSAAGFADVTLLRRDAGMNSVVRAVRPA